MRAERLGLGGTNAVSFEGVASTSVGAMSSGGATASSGRVTMVLGTGAMPAAAFGAGLNSLGTATWCEGFLEVRTTRGLG